MVTDGNYTYCGDRILMFVNIDSLYCTSGTTTITYANYSLIKKKTKQEKVASWAHNLIMHVHFLEINLILGFASPCVLCGHQSVTQNIENVYILKGWGLIKLIIFIVSLEGILRWIGFFHFPYCEHMAMKNTVAGTVWWLCLNSR